MHFVESGEPDLDTVIRQHLLPRVGELRALCSTRELQARASYRRLCAELEAALGRVDHDVGPAPVAETRSFYRIVAWNIQRGIAFDGIVHHLLDHPVLRRADVLLLTELDHGMARSGNRHVARDLGHALGMHSAFIPCYVNLTKGNGHERRLAGTDALGVHGNAILSRYPLSQFQVHALRNGKDKLAGPEKRIGQQRCLTARVELPGSPIHVSCIHLDAHSSRAHREQQMAQILDEIARLPGPVVLGGDWNTSTYNSQHYGPAALGFLRRLAMGVERSISRHYLHPERYFERSLFERLRTAGFDFEACNRLGEWTLRYDARATSTNLEIGDWIPKAALRAIAWTLRRRNGICPFKLDWFALRGASPADPSRVEGTLAPGVLHDLLHEGQPVSDHDPIVLDLCLPAAQQRRVA